MSCAKGTAASKPVANLSTNKADGLHSISAHLLKASFPFTVASLTHIFNSVISTGIIPSEWKSTRVPPIFKADLKVYPPNYRPLSVLSFIATLSKSDFQSGIYILGRQ